jgi:hypothetical protein
MDSGIFASINPIVAPMARAIFLITYYASTHFPAKAKPAFAQFFALISVETLACHSNVLLNVFLFFQLGTEFQ